MKTETKKDVTLACADEIATICTVIKGMVPSEKSMDEIERGLTDIQRLVEIIDWVNEGEGYMNNPALTEEQRAEYVEEKMNGR